MAVTALGPHSHDLDGHLHDDCEHCAEIIERQRVARVEARNDEALARHHAVAARNRQLWRWLDERGDLP
jgi:hypothetical protein